MKGKLKPQTVRIDSLVSTPNWLQSPWTVAAIYIILTLIFYRKVLSASHMVFGTDWLAGTYMMKQFIKSHTIQFHAIPQWMPHIYGGVPLFANPGDTYYLISLALRWILPVHLVNAYFYPIHSVIAGFFTFQFLRLLNLSFWPTFLGGLSYMFSGIILSHVYAGHEGRMAIIAFLPVVLYLTQLALERQTLASFLTAGLGLGFILLIPHVQMNYYLLIFVFFYFLFRLREILRESKNGAKTAKLSGYFIIFLAVGFLLSAIVYLPFYKYIPFSPRGGEEGRGYEFSTSWAMNPEETINLAVPDFSGSSVGQGTYWGRNFFKLHSEYMGATVILLAFTGVFLGRKNRLVWFLLVIILLSFTVAWGGHTPLYKLYYNLVPGFKKFRAPSLIFFLIAFSGVVLSALGLQTVIDRIKSRQNSKGLSRLILIFMGIVIGTALLVSIGSSGIKSTLADLISNQPNKLAALEANFPKFIAGMWKYVLLSLVIGGVLSALIREKLKLLAAGIILSVVTVLDLWLVESKFIQTVPPPEIYFSADEVTQRLKPDKTLFRVFPLQYRNDNYLMLFDLQSVAGEHGNQLQRYNEFLGAGKTSMVDYHNLMSNLNFLNLVNAKYVITQGPTSHPAFRELQKGKFYIYENLHVLPRVFMASRFEVIPESDKILQRLSSPDYNPRQTVILEKQPDLVGLMDSVHSNLSFLEYQPMKVRIQAELDQPGFLVLLDNYHPDWRAYVDGKETEVHRADYTFRAIQLESGKHQVEFVFKPEYYYLGKKITLFTLAGVLAVISGNLFFQRTRKNKTGTAQV